MFRLQGKLALAIALAVVALGSLVPGQVRADDSALQDLSLDELLDQQITSASKKAQRVVDTPSAAFVLTSEDIRRSGMTSIPDLLRLVPGVTVSQISSSAFAISARGFTNEFANKLLVMIDGRSVYTPLFSGVYWDIQDLMLEDIERIEVIRGPGSTVWGANAVNGVINIITKSSTDTEGSLATALAGNQDRMIAGARHGAKLSDDLSVRVWGKYLNRNSLENLEGQDFGDSWRRGRGGMRADWTPTSNDSFTFSGDWYTGDERGWATLQTTTENVPGTPLVTNWAQVVENGASTQRGGDGLVRWSHRVSENASTEVQLYYDVTSRNSALLNEKRSQTDLAFQNQLRTSDRNELVWGLGWRLNIDREDGSFEIPFVDERSKEAVYSGFLQDEFALIPERLIATLGSKVDWNTYTGWEVQPSVRMLGHLTDSQQLWGAVSRSVRTPSRAERTIDGLLLQVIPPGVGTCLVPPIFACPVRIFGDEELESESIYTFEVGYRAQPLPAVSLDVAAYRGRYNRLSAPDIDLASGGLFYANGGKATTYGVESTATWRVTPIWKLVGVYAFEHISANGPSQADEYTTPHNSAGLRSYLDLPWDLELDAALYVLGPTKQTQLDGSVIRFDSRWRGDLRLGWRPTPSLDIALVGQNLIDPNEGEWLSILSSRGIAEMPRAYYGKVTWSF